MKLLVICSTLDMDKPYGATPFVWQFLKGLSEVGCELTVVAYQGRSIRTPWWNSVRNPHRVAGEMYERLVGVLRVIGTSVSENETIRNVIVPRLAGFWVQGKWRKLIDDLACRGGFHLCVAMGVPLNHVLGTLVEIGEKLGCPLIYYDLDAPTSLPRFGGFSFSHYLGVDCNELDLILVPSVGSKKELDRTGARVEVLHFGVDSELYRPLRIEKDIEVFFFGSGAGGRERFIEEFMVKPARNVQGRFVISGAQLAIHPSYVTQAPQLKFDQVRNFACRAKINLNIPRDLQAEVETTSTSRPFELGAWECCVISRPYNSLKTWFKVGTEMLVASSFEEVMELYDWLLDDEEARATLGRAARARVLKEHTIRHRAEQFVRMAKNVVQ